MVAGFSERVLSKKEKEKRFLRKRKIYFERERESSTDRQRFLG